MKNLFVLVADADMRETLTTWRHCQCPAFAQLKHHLQQWFGERHRDRMASKVPPRCSA